MRRSGQAPARRCGVSLQSRYMAIVIAYLVSAFVAIGAVWLVAGRGFTVARDPAVNLAELGGRHVGILSGLAGYSVTGMVLLVTLGRNLADSAATAYTTVVTMFFVAWMAYSATAFLFINLHDRPAAPEADGPGDASFDVAAAQFAGAAVTLEFAFGLGWLALRPLFQAFGLQRLADLVAIVSVVIALASYGLVAHHLQRSGYGAGRVLVTIPTLTIAATLTYAAVANLLGLRTPDGTLNLIIVGFSCGAVAFIGLTTLIVSAIRERSARFLARYGRFLVLAYAQAVVLLVGFLLLSILGVA
jgi:hypothetical protein